MTILLTGASGKLGTELNRNENYLTPTSQELDIRSVGLVTEFARRYSFVNKVIHCAAYTNVPAAETNRKEAIETNIIGAKNIKQEFPQAKIIYVSSDYVYEGISGNYKETDQPKPFNFYGFTKLAGESFLDIKKDLIIRTSFKPSVWPYDGAFCDLFTSADYVDVIAQKIKLLINSSLTGIINVGTERKSIYNLASRRNANVKAITTDNITSVNLPKDISMCIDRFNEFERGLK